MPSFHPTPSTDHVIVARSRATRFASKGLLPVAIIVGIMVVFSGGLLLPLVVLGAIVFAVYYRKSLLAALRWTPAELVIDPAPLQLGASVDAIYRRRPRKVTDLPTTEIQLRLLCEEEVTYRQGKSTKTTSSTVVDKVFRATGEGTPHGFEASIRFEVPIDRGAPTMDIDYNKIRWRAVVTPVSTGKSARLPEDEQHFNLVVASVVDLDVRNRLGDR